MSLVSVWSSRFAIMEVSFSSVVFTVDHWMFWVTCTSFQQQHSSNCCPASLRNSMYLKMYDENWSSYSLQQQKWWATAVVPKPLDLTFINYSTFSLFEHRQHCDYPIRGRGHPHPHPHMIMAWPLNFVVCQVFVCLPNCLWTGPRGSIPMQAL